VCPARHVRQRATARRPDGLTGGTQRWATEVVLSVNLADHSKDPFVQLDLGSDLLGYPSCCIRLRSSAAPLRSSRATFISSRRDHNRHRGEKDSHSVADSSAAATSSRILTMNSSGVCCAQRRRHSSHKENGSSGFKLGSRRNSMRNPPHRLATPNRPGRVDSRRERRRGAHCGWIPALGQVEVVDGGHLDADEHLPSPGSGSGTSSSLSTFGPPPSRITIARIVPPLDSKTT
jgi:hypothetical protein